MKIPKVQKCPPKIYSEADFQRALRKSSVSIAKQSTMTYMGAFALTLHRELHLPPEQIQSAMKYAARVACESLCVNDLVEAVNEEIGADVSDMMREDMLD